MALLELPQAADPGARTHLLHGKAPARSGQQTAERLGPDSLLILLPAFTVSELTRAFEIGFLIYLPFIAIDLIISNILLAMGMMMVSPMTISPVQAAPVRPPRRLGAADPRPGHQLRRLTMSSADILHFTNQTLWLVLVLRCRRYWSRPRIGTLVSLVQALTQIQEQTLGFVAKLVAVVVVLFATSGWLGGETVPFRRNDPAEGAAGAMSVQDLQQLLLTYSLLLPRIISCFVVLPVLAKQTWAAAWCATAWPARWRCSPTDRRRQPAAGPRRAGHRPADRQGSAARPAHRLRRHHSLLGHGSDRLHHRQPAWRGTRLDPQPQPGQPDQPHRAVADADADHPVLLRRRPSSRWSARCSGAMPVGR